MADGHVSFASAAEKKTVAHAWVERYFMLVPGKEKYNFRIRPGVDQNRLPRFIYADRSFTLQSALKFLVHVHGGVDVFVTEEMRREAAACARATESATKAAEFILDRYRISQPLLGELRFTGLDGQTVEQIPWQRLDRMIGLPEVAILASLHATLGQSLLDRTRGQAVAWKSGPLGRKFRPARHPC